MFSQASSKYQDLVSKSSLISAGRPTVYRLRPRKEQLGTLTRLSVGERKTNQANKTILLVGETGTGKSALVNALFNHTMGVMWEDEVWFQIVEEDRDQTESQTSDVVVYQIFGSTALPFSLTIIDTPGYGDTRGIDRGDIVSDRLLNLFQSEDGVRNVHAVGLVMKSSECRLSDRLQYAFNSTTSLFGKDLERNIVALLTHSDGVTPKNALRALEAAKIKCAPNEKNLPTHFLFNNQQQDERTEDDEFGLEHAWKVTQRGMKQFTAFLDSTPPQTLDETVKVLNERVRLTACIQNLQDRVRHIELKQKEIQQTQDAVKKHQGAIERKEKFTYKVDEPYKVKEEVPGGWGFFTYSGAVCCTVCKETCHYPCTMAWYPSGCEVMKHGKCTVCTGKCLASSHVKEKWRYVPKTRKVTKTNSQLKEKYQSELLKKSELLENMKEEERKMMEEKWRLLDEAYQHVDSLEEIALNVNSVSTYVHYDFLIEKMKEKGDEEKVQRLEGIKRRVGEGNKSAVSYVWGKLPGIPKRSK